MEGPILIKYCNTKHKSKILFLCSEDKTLCCNNCAASHIDHGTSLISLKHIQQNKLAKYKEMKKSINILTKQDLEISNVEQFKTILQQKLDNSFEQMITRIREIKLDIIIQQMEPILRLYEIEYQIYKKLGIEELKEEIEGIYSKLNEYVNSADKNGDYESVVDLKDPEYFSYQMKEMELNMNRRKQFDEIDIKIEIDYNIIHNIFNIRGIENIENQIPVESILSNKYLRFILSQFPTPIKELNLIFSTKTNNPSTFHTLCDGISDTLIVSKANGRTFGGYTNQPWNTLGEFSKDIEGKSFLFSCDYEVKFPIKLNADAAATYGHEGFGPIFGGGLIIILGLI